MSTFEEPLRREDEELPGEEPREAEEPASLPREPDLAPPEEEDQEQRQRI